ncbi:unnamed protein product, partial [Ixodes hexagonus]
IGSFYQAPNSVHVTAASMLAPLFHAQFSPEINYGALGSILSHEVMRAFISNDEFPEGNGDVRERTTAIRWASTDLSCYENASGNSSAKDAELSLFLSDSMASQALFSAYKVAASGSRIRVAGLEGFTGDQLFFVSRCFYTCADEPHRRKAVSMEQRRCNFAVRNMPQFSRAFKCRKGAPMNPKQRCLSW